MGVDLEPWFVPMNYICNSTEDARVLAFHDSYSRYKVNSLGVGWIGPHTIYPYYFLLYVGVSESLCAFSFIVERRRCKN
jgi:hypothetical protein